MPKSQKTFSRVEAIPKTQTKDNNVIALNKKTDEVINLDQVDLADRENWLRALDICKAGNDTPLDVLLQEIEKYQGQIDQAIQTAQAQSTIYAYAIGSRLDVIEEHKLFLEAGSENLTQFIKAGQVKRPGGQSITTRQVWAYRSVTRGLNDFLSFVESIREGQQLSPEICKHIASLGEQINQDVVESFMQSYAENIAGVLELGVSKLEQVNRLEKSMALSGLLTGKIVVGSDIVEVHDVPFSQLRKAISSIDKPPTSQPNRETKPDNHIDKIERLIQELAQMSLNKSQKERLKAIASLARKL